ncbi:MAG: hypothetical protein BWY21_02210 [Parcubacteria group bacterium ADurb.Bin216]|nr:MAG: hypothetical protein BWY21_02210 [Parcubacteria group bacterium ADurb.Bin216]
MLTLMKSRVILYEGGINMKYLLLATLLFSCGKPVTRVQPPKAKEKITLFRSWSCSPVGYEDQFIVHLNLNTLKYNEVGTFKESVCQFDNGTSSWNCMLLEITAKFDKVGNGLIDIGGGLTDEVFYTLSKEGLEVEIPFNSYPLDRMVCK